VGEHDFEWLGGLHGWLPARMIGSAHHDAAGHVMLRGAEGLS
jgi:hypothetical protein